MLLLLFITVESTHDKKERKGKGKERKRKRKGKGKEKERKAYEAYYSSVYSLDMRLKR